MALQTLSDWEARSKGLDIRTCMFIDGEFAPAASGATFPDISPTLGEEIAAVAAGDSVDVDRAVTAARRSFERGDWSRAAPAERKTVLLRLADLMEEATEELALLETLDMGKPITDSLTIDVPGAISYFRWYAEAIDKIYDKSPPPAMATWRW
jgi:acyl-CoA reductase-like NAD-dependent aldehyde dehydrogenase